ncbi:hypothetical protein PAXRUDRAFT_178672, partial [Paxillus rubicundulus Ve08.2h10]
VFACLMISFYSLARLGELLVKTLKAFEPTKHVKRSDVVMDVEDWHGLKATKIRIPETKTTKTGKDIFYAEQSNLSDPKAALENHFTINDPLSHHHLFAYKVKEKCQPLMKDKFMEWINFAAKKASLNLMQGHGLGIGWTLEYLLRGVSFEVVKSMGRWSSNAFALYLCKHAMIMAPYLQDTPLLEPFTRYSMPPVR